MSFINIVNCAPFFLFSYASLCYFDDAVYTRDLDEFSARMRCESVAVCLRKFRLAHAKRGVKDPGDEICAAVYFGKGILCGSRMAGLKTRWLALLNTRGAYGSPGTLRF